MAQQTYRRRKEETINDLQSRVEELEGGIEEISHSFLDISKLLLETRILEQYPQITSNLQKITRQCATLAQNVNDNDNRELSESVEGPAQRNTDSGEQVMGQGAAQDHSTTSTGHSSIEPSHAKPNKWLVASSALPPAMPYGEDQVAPDLSLSARLPMQVRSPHQSPSDRGQWTFVQRLVRQSCLLVYDLLVASSGDVLRFQEVFGSTPSPPDRHQMITSLYRAIHYGEEIDLRANVLSSLRTEQTAYTLKQLESSSRTWEFACSMEWLDAHEVQKFLSEKGIQIQGNAFPFVIYDSNPGLISSLPLHLNVAAFIKCKSRRVDTTSLDYYC